MGEEVQIYRRKGEKSMEWDRGGGVRVRVGGVEHLSYKYAYLTAVLK